MTLRQISGYQRQSIMAAKHTRIEARTQAILHCGYCAVGDRAANGDFERPRGGPAIRERPKKGTEVITFSPAVVRQFHDDWLLFTVYSDGSVRQANTEMWPEHGVRGNWPRVMRVAALDEPRFAGRLLRFALEKPEVTREEFFELLNAWSLRLQDGDIGYAD